MPKFSSSAREQKTAMDKPIQRCWRKRYIVSDIQLAYSTSKMQEMWGVASFQNGAEDLLISTSEDIH